MITLYWTVNVLFIYVASSAKVELDLIYIVGSLSIIALFATFLLAFASFIASWKLFFIKDKLSISLVIKSL